MEPLMTWSKSREDATLLDVLIDGFEKNEIVDGFHWRVLPFADEAETVRRFGALAGEARHWKGPPDREVEEAGRRLVAWPDLEVRQAGYGIVIRVRTPGFADWWHDTATWEGDPMGLVHAWLAEERGL